MALTNTSAPQLAASLNGVAIGPKELDQTKLGVAEFRLVKVKVGAGHRIAARAVLQAVGVAYKANEEAAAVPALLVEMRRRADSAGGDAPLPERPGTKHLSELADLSPNEQVLWLHDHKAQLIDEAARWRTASETAAKRLPRWQTLNRLLAHAVKLPVADEVRPQVEAVTAHRSLLDESDPVPALADQVVGTLRKALTSAHGDFQATYATQMKALGAIEAWGRLRPEQQASILAAQGLASVPEVRTGTEAELLATLDAHSLDEWGTLTDALPQRFANAQLSAAKLLAPQAARVKLPSATIHTQQDMEAWLTKAREEIAAGLQNGPVIV
jgi:hypothetical protein